MKFSWLNGKDSNRQDDAEMFWWVVLGSGYALPFFNSPSIESTTREGMGVAYEAQFNEDGKRKGIGSPVESAIASLG